MEKENMTSILNEVKQVDNGINDLLIPLLRDTIQDGNRHNKRMFTSNIILAVLLFIAIMVSSILLYKQNVKYQEFLSQFDFETEVYQDTDDNSIINSGINLNR